MRNDVATTTSGRCMRAVLVSLVILCALLPVVAVLFAADRQYKKDTLSRDAAAAADIATQIGTTIRGVEHQLRTAAAFLRIDPPDDGSMRSLLIAVRSSNKALLEVAYLAPDGDIRTPAAGRELSPTALPTYHGTGPGAYISFGVPVGPTGEGGMIAAAVSGAAVSASLRIVAAAPSSEAYLFTAGGRLLAASDGTAPRVFPLPSRDRTLTRRIVSHLDGRSWLVSNAPVDGTDWLVVVARRIGWLSVESIPPAVGGAALLYAALLALLGILLLRRTSGGIWQQRLEEAATRNEMLLRETHHRIKNDLQILSSMLNLSDQSDVAPTAHQVLTESKNRLHAISLIHELLYKSPDLAGVNIRGYVAELARRIEHSLVHDVDSVSIVTHVGDYYFDADTCVACGLLLNELLTNSLKHAFPAGESGVILVRVERIRAGHFLLQVQDDGVGLPDECEPSRAGTLGMRLVNALTEQLGGSISVHSDPGTSWKILFHAVEVAVPATE